MTARDILELIWIVPLLPLVGWVVLSFFGRRFFGEPRAGWLAAAMVGLSFVWSVVSFCALQSLPAEERLEISTIYEWVPAGAFHVDLGFLVDPLSMAYILFVTGVATLIHVYAIGYMHGDERFARFFAWFNLFVASMLVLVLADNLLLTFLGWEGVGVASYLLIGFWYEKEENAVAGQKAFITNRTGDVGFLIAMLLIVASVGTLEYVPGLEAASGLSQGTATAIGLLLLVGAVGKSAQLPLSIWLPDSMAGPTPVSALIHAATMVTAGVYLIARTYPFFEASGGAALTTVAWVGALTCFLAGAAGTMQLELKKVLAYSTISQIGYMFLGLGVGAPAAAVFFVIMHAFFKATLFLGAGSLMHSNNDNQDMRVMGGFRRYMPLTALGFMAAWLSISGVFPFAGFWSKDGVLESAFFAGGWSNKAVWVLGTASIFFTAFYLTRQVWMVYFGNERFRKGVPVVSGGSDDDPAPPVDDATDGAEAPVGVDEPPAAGDLAAEVAVDLKMPVDPEPQLDEPPPERNWLMTVPLLALAALATVGGIINLPFTSFENLDKWLEPVFEGTKPIHAPSFLAGFSLSMLSLAIAVGTILFTRHIYRRGLPGRTDILPGKVGRLSVVVANAFYLDRLVSWCVRRPGRWFADFLAGPVDERGIDGAVNGIGRLFLWGSRNVRRVQTGNVRNYALGVLVGSALIILYVVWRVL